MTIESLICDILPRHNSYICVRLSLDTTSKFARIFYNKKRKALLSLLKSKRKDSARRKYSHLQFYLYNKDRYRL